MKQSQILIDRAFEETLAEHAGYCRIGARSTRGDGPEAARKPPCRSHQRAQIVPTVRVRTLIAQHVRPK